MEICEWQQSLIPENYSELLVKIVLKNFLRIKTSTLEILKWDIFKKKTVSVWILRLKGKYVFFEIIQKEIFYNRILAEKFIEFSDWI